MSKLGLTAYQRRRLRQLLHKTADARLYRRLLVILEVDRGRPVSELARLLNLSSQSIYNWIDRFLHQGGEPALADRYGIGRPTLWTEEHVALLRALFESSPDQWGYFANDWTVPLLQEQLLHWSGQTFSEDTVRRELHRLGYVWKRGRYRLAADPELEKKNGGSAGRSAICGPGAFFWPKTRPTCCCSHRCGPVGRCGDKIGKSQLAVRTPGVWSSVP